MTSLKILKLYRLADTSLIGEYPLYSSPGQVVCTGEYIALAMADRRLVSMLICDTKAANREKIEARIHSLERRRFEADRAEFLEKLLVKSGNLFGSSSHIDPEVLFRGLFGAKQENSSYHPSGLGPQEADFEKARGSIVTADSISVFCERMDGKDLAPDWQLDLIKRSKRCSNLKRVFNFGSGVIWLSNNYTRKKDRDRLKL